MQSYMMIGEVLKPQGVRGEAKLRSYAADADSFFDWTTLYLRDGADYLPIGARCVRVAPPFVYVQLDGCTRPEDVDALRGRPLFVPREMANPLAEDELYIADLVGLTAVDERGETIGRLTDVLQNGPVDVYVFKTDKGSLMAPALKAVFPSADLTAGTLRVVRDRLNEVAVWENEA